MPSLLDRVLRRKPTGIRRKLLLQALKAAEYIEQRLPKLTIKSQDFRKHLRKYKRDGRLLTSSISEVDRTRLRSIIDDLPVAFLGQQKGGFDLLFDTGCSHTTSGFKEDFVEGTLSDLQYPVQMSGIGGNVTVNQRGVVRYEVIDDDADIQVLLTHAYYTPAVQCRLFSPQAYLAEQSSAGTEGEMVVRANKSVLKWANGKTLSIQYDESTNLPKVRAYKDAIDTASVLALKGNVDDETNQNLTSAQKTLLRWHFRLGHIGFAAIQWLGRQGFLGLHGEKMGAANLQAPKCAACQFGKQGKTPTPSKHGTNEDTGALSKDKLEPGQLVFMDQYQSRLPGRAFTSKGLGSSSLQFQGGTLFYDAASAYIYCHHQIGLTASETLESKMKFEREAMTNGVSVQAYHTDNGVFTSKEFMKELGEKGQGMTLSGVSAQFQNGAAENGIKIVVRNSRTMMLHAALRWPGFAERDLWPMALSHAVHLYNHTPRQESGLAPIELFSKTKSEHKMLLNSHPWGCPTYVLEPKLRDGHKLPKWDPRSKRGQYMGASPMHASTVGLVRNLQTGAITPQFHMVYDDFFETVHSDEGQEPSEWPDLLAFSRFQSDFDSEDYLPELDDEWLNPEELQERTADREEDRQRALQGLPQQAPPAQAPPQAVAQQPQPLAAMPPAAIPAIPANPPAVMAPPVNDQQNVRRSTRQRREVVRFNSDDEYKRIYGAIAAYCMSEAKALVSTVAGPQSDFRYLRALLTDVDTGGLEGLHPGHAQFPMAFKANKKDPDTPTYHEAMSGEHRSQFEEAMAKEIMELEEHKTWQAVSKNSLPTGTKVLPSTWAFRIKRFPDGRHRKFKARFCVRGDRQVEGVDYSEKYSPVVGWSTVRMLLCLSLSQGLKTRQVDFSNAFVQAELKRDEFIYIDVPKGFETDSDEGTMVLKLKRSLYGLVQAPLYWNNHLKSGFEKAGLKQSVSDPCMFYGDGVIALTYVDDVLFFSKTDSNIDGKIKVLQDKGYKMTVEDDVYAFLGVEIHRQEDGSIEMKHQGLIDKVLLTCGMKNCNTKATPCNSDPLGTDVNGVPVTGKFEYASAVGMLMYLCSNTRPDIQYAVHQCARFSHFPKKSHEDAILRICRYLQGTKNRGLRFKPDEQLKLDCYCDADFAGLYNVENKQDPVCVKSRTGYCLTLGNCPVIWVSKLQTEIALSTTEAEYIALSQSMRDLIPMRRLLQEAGTALALSFSQPAILHSTVFEDNNGALTVATSPRISPRTKHIAVKYHHFKTSVGEGKGIIIQKIDTDLQKADIFTKGLASDKHKAIRKLLMGW